MKIKALKQGLNAFNLLFVATFIVLALYSAIGQQIFPYIGQYRVSLENYLSSQLNGDVNIRRLSGDMDVLTPSVHIEGVSLYTEEYPDQAKVSIAAIDAVLDPRRSLMNLTPVFKSVRLSGLYVRIDGDKEQPSKAIQEEDAILVKRLIEALLLQQHVDLNNVTVENVRADGTKILHLEHLTLTGDGFNRLITGNITYGSDNKLKAGIRLYSRGSPFKLDKFYARGAIDLPDFDVDYWLNDWFDFSVFNEFAASSQLRFEFENGLLNYAKLSVASPSLLVSDGRKIDQVNAKLWCKQNAPDRWSFWIEDADFILKQKPWHFSDVGVGISKIDNGNQWQAYIKEMEVTYLQDFLTTLNVLPQNLQDLLSKLQIKGGMKDMNVIMQQVLDQESSFTLAGNLTNITTQPSGGIPGVTNLNGVLAINDKSGRVQFDTQDMVLSFPNIYEEAFEFPQAKGQVDWLISDAGFKLTGSGLSVNLDTVNNISGGFKVWMYEDEQWDDKLELNLSLKNAQVAAQTQLVPKILSENLRSWLDRALIAGNAPDGQFYLYTGLNKDSHSQSELSLSIDQGILEYLPQWPRIENASGHLFVQNDHVYAQLDSASTLGGAATGTQIVFDGIASNQLWITSKIKGVAEEGLMYFQQTPLKDLVKDLMASWQTKGIQQTQLGLRIPLSSEDNHILADVRTELTDVDLDIADVGLKFIDTNGRIEYSSSKGLTSKNLSTNLWGELIKTNITSVVHESGFSSDIAFNGRVETDSIKQWLNLPLLKPIQGATNVDGSFKISGEKNGFTGLVLNSNLIGVDVELPEPFAKTSEETADFKLKVSLDDGEKLSISYDDMVNVALHLKQGEIKAGQVFLGSTEAFIPSFPGVEILGHVTSIDLNQWLNTIKQLKLLMPAAASSKSTPLFRTANISTDMLIYDGFQFEQVKASLNHTNSVWTVDLDAPIAKGLVTLSEEQPIGLNLEYIHWPAFAEQENEEDKEDLFSALHPDMFPDVDLDVGEIFIGPRNYGRWVAKMRSEDNTLSISDINGTIKKLDVKGNIKWVKSKNDPKKESTVLKLNLSSNDVAGIQKAWRSKPVLEAKDAKLQLDFNWGASPTAIKSELVNGNGSVSLKDGRFLDTGDTGALSAFGILNFGAIGRRLRLDFSDVYQSGLHFDSVNGKVKVNNGVMSIIDTLDIKGPSAKFAASGTVDLNTKILNQDLSVTFPITSTLPFVAILAGFAPPVAASLFVGEQLVGDQIEKYTSATYKLSGTWDEPNLKLVKRFDNNIEGKQDQGFWYRMKDFFGLGDKK